LLSDLVKPLENLRCANGFWQSIQWEAITEGPIDFPPEAPMTQLALDVQTPLQRLIVERALVLAKELEATADSAPHGQIIDRCESLLLGVGRDFLRRALEDTL
jgi:hypothetical protein